MAEKLEIANPVYNDVNFWENMYKTVSNGDIWNAEVRNINKKGEYYWVDTTIVGFRKDDKLVSYIAIRTDITDKKKSEEELTEALESLNQQTFALNAHSIVAITDIKGTITFVNEKFEEISGYTKEELIGKNHRILNSGLHGVALWRVCALSSRLRPQHSSFVVGAGTVISGRNCRAIP